MHKSHIAVCGVLLLVILVSFVYQNRKETPPLAITEGIVVDEVVNEVAAKGYTEKTDETGPVAITVQPMHSPGSDTWEFDISLQTHSVELDMDMLQSVTLLDSNGNEIVPQKWDGSPPGGHHRTGILTFESADLSTETLNLRMKDIGGIAVRELTWALE